MFHVSGTQNRCFFRFLVNEKRRKVPASDRSSQDHIDILAFSLAFLNKAELRLVIEYLLNFLRLDMVFEGKFIDDLAQPDDAFDLHSFPS